jgi:lipopolysaccharide/colanic/teichoic acid biosynthesis glycosyltransferase
MDDGGPVLFTQTRIGHRGRRFTVYKFRTMRIGAPGQDARAAAMTGDLDPRVTRVGAFLRRTRIDELPQVFNILRAEMSWIGPRPEAEVLSLWYVGELPFYRYRHVVKPGISGWAQTNQGHVAEVDEVHRKLQFDFYYIKYFSPWLDMLILFKTVRTMFNGFGAR